jgi:hypothetical protein
MDAVGLKPGGLIDGFPVAGVFCMQQLHHASSTGTPVCVTMELAAFAQI